MEENRSGLKFGISSYLLWGFIPIYWKLLPAVPAFDILCYRIIWSLGFMALYLFVTKKYTGFLAEWHDLRQNKRKLAIVFLAAIMITINWGAFIYAVSQGNIQDASLGYYINPLVNVLLATIILKEPLERNGKIACILAFIGVVIITIQAGHLPVSSLIMAFAFSFYGLIKKGLTVSSTTGLTIETLIMTPFAFLYLFLGPAQGFMNYELSTNLLLAGAGVITAVPLLLFSEAAKRLSYITLGFLQYMNPTIQLLLAIFLFRETYTFSQFIAFCFIWLGIIVFMWGNYQHRIK